MIEKKRVNIYPRRPIPTEPPIRVPVKNTAKTIKDIRKAILCGAKVEEILPNGTLLVLNIQNYDLDNSKNVIVKNTKTPDEVIKRNNPIQEIDYKAAKPSKPNIPVSNSTENIVPSSPVRLIDKVIKQDDVNKKAASENIENPFNLENNTTEDKSLIEDRLTRKQRRILERKQRELENSNLNEENIETKDPE